MKTVVAHRGARDDYQVALALQEAGLLESLCTDLYWAAEKPWARGLERTAGAQATQALRARYKADLNSALVKTCAVSGFTSFALDKVRRTPFSLRKLATRWTDAAIGTAAGGRARATSSAILSYSYYGYAAFSKAPPEIPKILFQLHPHPASMRRILGEELQTHPECETSLKKEWELSLPDTEYRKLVDEVLMAKHWLAASSFTRATLAENGVDASRVHVVPYGVHLDRLTPGPGRSAGARPGPLKLLFVGTINQRKGISYLLNALKEFRPDEVELLVCGRAVDNLALFDGFGGQARVRVSVSSAELLNAYQTADLFVFPSIAEGFGHVLLEAMACGLPILSTTSTAAPDLITDGQEGFVVPPRRPDLLVERIRYLLDHRSVLPEMASAARRKAETFTWPNFRSRVASIVGGILDSASSARTEKISDV